MRKRIYFYISAVILIALIFAVFSCTPERRFTRFAKKHPALFDTVVTSDTVIIVDSVTIHSTNTIRTTEIDSIIVDCPDAVKPKIRDQIKARCTIESILGKPRLVNDIGGHHIITAKGDDMGVYCSRKHIKTETTVYLPNDCEREMKEYRKLERQKAWTDRLMGVGVGVILTALMLVLISIRKGLR